MLDELDEQVHRLADERTAEVIASVLWSLAFFERYNVDADDILREARKPPASVLALVERVCPHDSLDVRADLVACRVCGATSNPYAVPETDFDLLATAIHQQSGW